MAAAWGRFAEFGFAPIDDRRFPSRAGASCMQPFSSAEQLFRCIRFYETDPVGDEVPFVGYLNPYVFRTPAEAAIIDEGPAAVARQAIDGGTFATCTVRRMWTHFMRRAPTPEEETTIVPVLRDEFVAGGYVLRELIADLVRHPAYRRLP